MSRINSLTNRTVKLNTRTYAKLIAEGLIDDGVMLRKKQPMYKVDNHKKSVELNSEGYKKFLSIGYTPEVVGGVNTLVAPKLSKITQSFSEVVKPGEVKYDSKYDVYDVEPIPYKRIRDSLILKVLTEFNSDVLNYMKSGKYGGVKITARKVYPYNEDDVVLYTLNDVLQDTTTFKNAIKNYIYWWIKQAVRGMLNGGIITLKIDVYFQTHVLPEFGVLYHSDEIENVKNCMITLFKEHMESQGKADNELIERLFEKYQDGFFQVDFEYLAQKVQAKIHVKSPLSTKIYGAQSKGKNLYINVNNNHASLSSKEEERGKLDTEWVDDIDYYLKDVVYNPETYGTIKHYRKGITLMTSKKIYKNKVYKFHSENGVIDFNAENIPFSFYSETGYYKNLFLKNNTQLIEIDKSEKNKNLDAIKSISQHGIHYSVRNDGNTDGVYYTYDLKQAYTNYYKWHIYEGIPTDLDSCINNTNWETQKEEILNNTGFCLIEYVDLYNKTNTERWVSIPYVKMLIRQKRSFTFKYALISRNKTDLNLSDFIDETKENGLKDGVNKRQWHKVLGSINARYKKDTFCTTDPLISYAGLGSEYCTVKSQGEDINLYYATKTLDEPGNFYYPHVSSYIQFYSEIMLEEIAFEAQKKKEGRVMSVWVDEITVSVDMNDYFKSKDMLGETKKECGVESNIHFHTGKISKIQFMGVDVVYRTPINPGKFSKRFNGILQNRGNKVLLTGGAGCGKTHISSELSQQMNIDILTPTHEAGQQFIERGGKYETVAHKIAYIPESGYKRSGNILIDECSMVNSDERDKLESLNPSLLLFTGDDKQLEPVEGVSMTLNLSDSYNIIELTANFRQMLDPEFSRKLNILRLNSETDEKFGTIITEHDAIDKVKNGGIFACQTNERVKYFNSLCNGGLDYVEGSRIRFKENKLKLGYHKGLLGVVCKAKKNGNDIFKVITHKNTFELHDVKNHIELAYAMTIHKLQGKTLKQAMVYDDKKPLFKNVRYTAYSRLIQERDLFILK
jgi:hypothetical protein